MYVSIRCRIAGSYILKIDIVAACELHFVADFFVLVDIGLDRSDILVGITNFRHISGDVGIRAKR